MSFKKSIPWLATFFLVGLLAASWHSPDSGPVEKFARLPVLQGGRIKPMDSIARVSLLMLQGKQSIRINGREAAPSEWFLNVMAKPDEANEYKVFLIHDPDVLGLMGREQTKEKYFSFKDLVPYLQEIQSQAARAESVEAQARDRFQTAIVNLHSRIVLYQRLKNTLHIEGYSDLEVMAQAYQKSLPEGLASLKAHQKGGHFDLEALRRLGIFISEFEAFSKNSWFYPLVPLSGPLDRDWETLGSNLISGLRGEAFHSMLMPYIRLGSAWRRADGGIFEASIGEIWKEWETRAPAVLKKTSWETLFNRAQPFYQGMLLYAAAFLLGLAAWAARPLVLRRTALHLLVLAFAVHTVGLVTRMWLEGRPPVTNLYSSAIFVGWSAALLGLAMEWRHKNGFGGLVASLVGFCTLIVAHHLMDAGDTLEMMRAVLDSNFWLATHVTVITIGYSSMFLAGSMGLFYILRRFAGASEEKLRPLSKMAYGVICFSLLFSFTGTVLGGIWADQSWGRFWGWDPKENGALLIVLWNALILHARWGGFVRDRGIAVMAVFGNVITSLSWFGVNMLGIGLHSYGFMDKAFYALSAFVASQLILMALAFAPPGSLAFLLHNKN